MSGEPKPRKLVATVLQRDGEYRGVSISVDNPDGGAPIEFTCCSGDLDRDLGHAKSVVDTLEWPA